LKGLKQREPPSVTAAISSLAGGGFPDRAYDQDGKNNEGKQGKEFMAFRQQILACKC
jgi:hypothetical protein